MHSDSRLIASEKCIGGRGRTRRIRLLVTGFLLTWVSTGSGLATGDDDWRTLLLRELSSAYLEEEVTPDPTAEERQLRLDRLFRELGRRLARSGVSAVPVRHIASLALLGAELPGPEGQQPVAKVVTAFDRPCIPADCVAIGSHTPGMLPHRALSGGRRNGLGARETFTTGCQPSTTSAVDKAAPRKPDPEPSPEDSLQARSLTKGQEGFRQAIEQFQELPMSERMVMTGDVTSGVQMATVPGDSPHLTSVFGRTRVNFTLRALPARSQVWDEGYFFLQIGAAGGPFDSSVVGGPESFSSFNDVASDRSRFNEPIARGNLYLGKAFYEQGIRWGSSRLSARAGVFDVSDYFDTNQFANNEVRQFVNSAFVNGAAYKTGVVAPGLVGEYERPLSYDRLRGVAFRVGYAVSRTERAFTSPLWTTEAELRTVLKNYPGHWRLGMTLGNVAGEGGVRGIYVSADQWVSPRVGVFGRYGVGNSGPGALVFGPVRTSYSGGIQWRFAAEGVQDSALGLAFSQAFGISDAASEKVMEAYYRWQVTRNFAFTPDFHPVFGSGGRSAKETQGVLGARVHVSF